MQPSPGSTGSLVIRPVAYGLRVETTPGCPLLLTLGMVSACIPSFLLHKCYANWISPRCSHVSASIRCFFFSVIDQRMSSLWKLTKLLKLYGATSLIPNQLWKKMASRCVTLFWHLGAGGRFLDCLLQLVSFSTTIMKTTPEDIIMSVAMLCSSLVDDGGRNHTNPFK